MKLFKPAQVPACPSLRPGSTVLTRQKSSSPNILKFLISPQLILAVIFVAKISALRLAIQKSFTFRNSNIGPRPALKNVFSHIFKPRIPLSHTLCRGAALTVCGSIIIATNSQQALHRTSSAAYSNNRLTITEDNTRTSRATLQLQRTSHCTRASLRGQCTETQPLNRDGSYQNGNSRLQVQRKTTAIRWFHQMVAQKPFQHRLKRPAAPTE